MGRPFPDITPYIDKLVNAILIGATYELAALYAGISVDTFGRWRKKAATAPAGTPLALLHERLQEAEGRAAIGWLAKIEKVATEGDWKAAAWKLERRYPETYGRTFQKVALTTPDGEAAAQPTIIFLPAQSPSAEEWAQSVQHLLPTNGHKPDEA
jgi:hypothetical protein